VNFVYLFFLAAAWIVVQCLIGGTRLLFSLPAYGLVAMAAVLSIASLRSRRVPPGAFCIFSTLLMGGWVLYRASTSPIRYLAMPDYYMMIGCLTVYLLTAYYLVSMRDRTILLGVLWAIAALEVFCGLVQFLKDNSFMLFGLTRSQNIERASGMFISPNHFAGFLEAVAIISISMAIWSRWPLWGKALAMYMALACWLGVAISGSRGGYFSTIASLVVFASGSIYVVRLADRAKFLLAVSGTLSAVIFVVAAAAFLMSHSDLLTMRMHTMVVKDIRIYNWEAALDHIRVSPWVGTGSGTHLIYGRLFRRTQIQADPVHAHCDYLELLAEYGIAGGACMLLFLVAHAISGIRAFSDILHRRLLASGVNRSNSFALNFGAVCAFAGLAVHSVVDFNMHIPGNALLFAFIFGMLANPGLEHAPSFVGRRIVPAGRILLPVLGGWMIWSGLPLLPSEWCAEQARQDLRDGRYFESMNYANLALGRYDDVSKVPPEEVQAEPAILAWVGGVNGLVHRFGPDPLDPDLYFYLGEANRALGDRMPLFIMKKRYFNAAIPNFQDELKIFPQDENAMVRLAQCLDGLHQYGAAEEVFQKCFHLDPHLGTIFEYYAKHLTAEGRTADAASMIEMARGLDASEVDAEHKADNMLR
jgi:O-antigen ligase